MTKEEILSKIEKTKKNSVLTDAQKKQLLEMYNKKLAEFGGDEKPTKEPKPKEEKKHKEPKEHKSDKDEELYDCDELIEAAKKRKKSAKKAAKKAANKTEGKKSKDKIDRVHHTIETQVEKGKLHRAELERLIKETKELLVMLQNALKNSK